MERLRAYNRDEVGIYVTDAQHNALSLVQTRLYHLDGAEVQRLTRDATGNVSVDVKLSLPSAPLVKDSQRRRDGFGSSSFQIDADGGIIDYVLRLPPLPAEDFGYAETYTTVFSMAERCSGQFYISVHLSLGTEAGDIVSWWPHVSEAPSPTGTSIAGDAFMSFIRELFHQYCERYEWGV